MGKYKAVLVSDETPEDIATLYSWANLHGAKYRDFSANRARARESARARVQEAIDAEQKRMQEATVAATEAPVLSAESSVVAVDVTGVADAVSMPMVAQAEVPVSAGSTRMQEQPLSAPVPLPMLVPEEMRSAATQMPLPAKPVAAAFGPGSIGLGSTGLVSTSPAHRAPQWFALKGILADTASRSAGNLPLAAQQPVRVPALAVFSLAGGVGKSCVVATLARTLASHGERVLMVDTAIFGTLQYFFGAHEQKIGVARTFKGPDASGVAPIDLLSLEAEAMAAESNPAESLTNEILRNARSANRILIDMETSFVAIARRVLRMSPTVLVPVTPDVRSVASVCAIDAFFQRNPSGTGQTVAPLYVLNQFDEGRRLHQDVRTMLQNQLGERLLPFVLHRAPAVSEALAEGMTVVDYAPGSQVANDYETLAEWVRTLAAPSEHVYWGVRWSER